MDEVAARIAAAGRAAWPAIALADEAIAAQLAQRALEDPGAAVGGPHDADQYLAFALAAGG